MTVNTDETDMSQLTAQLSDGVLTLTAPPKAKPDPVEVTVTMGQEVEDDDNDKSDKRIDNDDKKTTRMMRRSIEIPGVKLSDLKVTLEEGTTVHVRGTRRGKAPVHKSFRIDTEKINSSEITASLSHGILTVQAPMLPCPQPQTLAIETVGPTTTTTPMTGNDSAITTSANGATKSDASVLATVDIPGVRSQDVTVSTVRVDQHHTALDIRASRNYGNDEDNNKTKKLRISKQVLLDHDTYNVDELKAQLLDGVLTITAPKKPDAEPRVVPITVETNTLPSPKAIADEGRDNTNENENQEKKQ